ncbi:MAG: sulfotransferase [Bacteroidaceae bacterium]|nr:sulfotransferase [Bacteroidaceae bacterium]
MGFNFQKLPANTLVGASWSTFKGVCEGRRVDKKFKGKYRFTKLICRILSSINFIENRRYKKRLGNTKLNDSPLFIIGHWRSGTTFVHNVFACDKQFGYTTTYQTVFPFMMFTIKWFFKKMAALAMPAKREADNMELNTDQPQEEEFALSNMSPYSFYNFWIFPQDTEEYRSKYLLFETITEEEKASFKECYERLVKTSVWDTKGKRYLSKNPPHTGRIKFLLEMFPNAKFIYLVRNPYTVLESTRNFFSKTIQPLKLQDYSMEELDKDILETYTRLYNRYEADKGLIPEGNLVELRFEDFEADPFGKTKEIYEKLSLGGWDEAKDAIEAYIGKKKGHKKNAYKYKPETVELVDKHWGYALKQWDYNLGNKD